MARVFALFLLLVTPLLLPAGPVDPQAWQVIHKALQSGDFEHRRQAVAALGTIDAASRETVDTLTNVLRNDKDARVRRQAAEALGQMKAARAIEPLKDALSDTAEVAFAAAKALTDLGDAAAGRDLLASVLTGARKDSPGIMTNAKREAENRFRHTSSVARMGAENAVGAMFGPAGMAVTAFEEAAHLNDNGSSGRASAAAYLAKSADPYAVTLLEWALHDGNKTVRMEAARGLGQRGNEGSISKLEPLLKDRQNAVRTMAAASIIRLGMKELDPTSPPRSLQLRGSLAK